MLLLFIVYWLISALAILITAYLLPGVAISGFGSALWVAIVLGLVNTFIRPLLIILTLPINILTLGLFTLVINAVIILIVSAIVPSFRVSNFGWALLFSVILAIINYILHAIIPY